MGRRGGAAIENRAGSRQHSANATSGRAAHAASVHAGGWSAQAIQAASAMATALSQLVSMLTR